MSAGEAAGAGGLSVSVGVVPAGIGGRLRGRSIGSQLQKCVVSGELRESRGVDVDIPTVHRGRPAHRGMVGGVC